MSKKYIILVNPGQFLKNASEDTTDIEKAKVFKTFERAKQVMQSNCPSWSKILEVKQ